MAPPDDSRRRSHYVRAGLWLVTAALLAAALWYVRPTELPIHHDTNRDLYHARQAVETGRGPLVGPPTSLSGLSQGALWVVHLASLLGLGADLDAVALVSALCLLLALVALVGIGAALGEFESGIVAALLAGLVLVVARDSWVRQWNPSLLLLPAALTTLFTLEAVRFRSALPTILAAAALGLTAQLHPTAWLLIPVVAFALWRAHAPNRPPWPLVGVAGVLVLAPFGVFAAQAVYQDLVALGNGTALPPSGEGHQPTLWWCAGTAVAAALAAFATIFRPAYARAQHRTVALLAGLPATLFLLAGMVTGVQPAPRHLLPFLPAAALVVASTPSNLLALKPIGRRWHLLKWLPAPLAAAGLAWAAWTAHPAGITYTYAEAEWVADQLSDEGLCDPEVVAASLHAPHAWALLGALQGLQLGDSPCFRKAPVPRLVVPLPARPEALPDTWRLLDGPGRLLALIPQPDIVDWRLFEWRGPGAERFAPAALALDSRTSTPGYPAWQGFQRNGQPGCLHLKVAVTVPADETATLVALPQAPLGGTSEKVVAVTGLHMAERGGNWVALRSPEEATGFVELAWCIDHPVPQEVLRGIPPLAVGLGDEGRLIKELFGKEGP